jgi:hypothetical protein
MKEDGTARLRTSGMVQSILSINSIMNFEFELAPVLSRTFCDLMSYEPVSQILNEFSDLKTFRKTGAVPTSILPQKEIGRRP